MIYIREEVDYTEAVEAFKSDDSIKLEPWGMEVDHLRLTITGRPGTPYNGGHFMFEIRMNENYPFEPPYVYCFTPIWHPNIDTSINPGKINICLDLINPELVGKVDVATGASGWTPSKTLTNIIEALKGQIHCEPPFFNPGDPLNFEAGDQALNHYNKFESKAKEWTKKYAMN
ncbi:MAG: ubiquitin-conjugating enzyme E2 [Promethearchaeota archaeon]